MTRKAALVLALLAAALLLAGCAGGAYPAAATEPAPGDILKQYVDTPDPAYGWNLVASHPGDGYTLPHDRDDQPETWLTEAEVDRPLWTHWLLIVQPDEVRSDHAFLYISGGRNGGDPPEQANPLIVQPALATGSFAAELRMVPNQTLTFVGDDFGERREDQLIAYGWDKFLRGEDAIWLARLPMTKAAVRAMDTMTAFAASEDGGAVRSQPLRRRGRLEARLDHLDHGDRRRAGDRDRADRHRHAEPRTLLHSPLAGLRFLGAGRRRLRARGDHGVVRRSQVPRTPADHGAVPAPREAGTAEVPDQRDRRPVLPARQFPVLLRRPDRREAPALRAEHRALAGRQRRRGRASRPSTKRCSKASERPDVDWSLSTTDDGAAITASVANGAEPSEVLLWQASNPEARDFRVDTIGRAWTSTAVDATDGQWIGAVDSPATGWSAFFLEFTFPGPGEAPFKFSTEIEVTPEDLPFGWPPEAAGE